jgi:hypothetical protein
MLSDYKIDVVMIEPEEAFVSCPLSNLVVGGSRQLADISTPYTALERKHGVRVVRDLAQSVDTQARKVKLAGGAKACAGYSMIRMSRSCSGMRIPSTSARCTAAISASWRSPIQPARVSSRVDGMTIPRSAGRWTRKRSRVEPILTMDPIDSGDACRQPSRPSGRWFEDMLVLTYIAGGTRR